MSLKKDKFSTKDKFYMKLALNLAREKIGLTGLNPSVGCVIVKNDQIISIGQTSDKGRPHAEYNAIKSSKEKLEGSSIYISLEPCNHYGKTPPCTNLIIKNKIKKVFYAIDDIDIRSAKKSYKILKKNKVLVKKNLLRKKAFDIYKSYFFVRKNNFPYVTGKIACSRDNFITTKNKIITNKYSQKVSHLLRFKNSGILISYKTLNLDNSKLTCRLPGLENNSPIRFILDKNLKIKKNSYVVKTARNIKTYVFFNKLNKVKKNFLKKKGLFLIKSKLDNQRLNLNFVLKKINNLGISHLLVEGGLILTNSLLNKRLINEFYLFKSNKKLRNKGKNNISKIINKLPYLFNNKKNINTYLGKDKLINYY